VFTVLRTEVERLSALMQDLLEYGRPHSLEVEPCALADVVARAAASTQAVAADRRIRVVNEVPSHIVLAMDKRRLEQVFQNLIVNSIQHLNEGGSVSIDASTVQDGGREWVSTSVQDTGPGFREEDLVHVFEPFFTRRHGGTGLGLSIVARIVDDHGGRIQARNRKEGGAVITVRLPRSDK
ncbi:MAG: sensor histidine kinase, partial [Vicinamibacteria bacterium]